MRILTPIFSWNKPIWALINSLKYFGLDFAKLFDHKVISAVCIILQRWSLRCAAHCGSGLCCVHHTAETISADCISTWRRSPLCAAHCRDNKIFNILYFKAILLLYTVCVPPYKYSQCAAHRGNDLYGVQHTAEMISTVCIIPLRWSPWCASYH